MSLLSWIVVVSPFHVALPASDGDLAAGLSLESLLDLSSLAKDSACIVILVVSCFWQVDLPAFLQVLPVRRWNKLRVHFLEFVDERLDLVVHVVLEALLRGVDALADLVVDGLWTWRSGQRRLPDVGVEQLYLA